jgi:HEAT repeat protein
MRGKHHVYIGFARDDGREIAERVYEELTQQGLSAEFDNRILNTDFDISVSIESAIKRASIVVFCLTPSLLRNEDSLFRRELVFAHICGKQIATLIFPDFPIQEISPLLENTTVIPFFNSRNPSQGEFTSGINRLQQWLSNPTTATYDASKSHHDPYCDYLAILYKDIVAELEVKVSSFVLHETLSPDKQSVWSYPYPAPILPIAFSIPRSESDTSTHAHAVSDEIFDYFDNLVDALDYLNYRALLVGSPDSGKTTILLACTRDAITLRFDDTLNPVPFYISIASWSDASTQPMTSWICQQTGLDQHLIEDVVNGGQALLLLDGLDQLNQSPTYDKRLAFMHQLEHYLDHTKYPSVWLPQDPARYNQFLITCQYDDYIMLDQRQPRYGVVTLQSLERTLITEYFAAYPELLTAIATNRILEQLLQKPFILSAFLFAYAGRTNITYDLRRLDNNIYDTQRRILDDYIARRHLYFLDQNEHFAPYDLDDIYTILGELAIVELNEVNAISKVSHTTKGIWIERLSEIINQSPTSFVDQMCQLSLLIVKPSRPDIVYFPHPLLRNHFALLHAMFVLDSGEIYHQRNAIRILGKLGAIEALPTLIDLLSTADNSTIRWDAATALGDIADNRAIESLVNALLNDPDWKVRQKAADVLANINHLDTIEPLKEAYNDPKAGVRTSVIKTLGIVGGIHVMKTLITALADDDKGVRWTAKEALKNIGDPSVNHLLKLINAAGKYNIPPIAVPYIGEIVIDRLIAVLFDPDAKDSRLNVVETLKRIGEPAIAPLLNAAESGNDFEKGVAAVVLGHIGSTAAVGVLMNLSGHQNAWIRINAIQALGDIGDERAIPVLVELLDDDDEPFQNERICNIAAESLRKIRTPEALAAVIEWQRNQNTDE